MPRNKPLDDRSVALAVLKRKAATFARERDWEQFHAPKNLSMAIAAEAAELMEHFLWVTSADSARLDPRKKTAVEAELADIMLFLLQLDRKSVV